MAAALAGGGGCTRLGQRRRTPAMGGNRDAASKRARKGRCASRWSTAHQRGKILGVASPERPVMPQNKLSRTSKHSGSSPSRPATSDRAVEAALKRFNRRATHLAVAYLEQGMLTQELERAVLKLERDVEDWRERSGRDEIRATRSTRRQSSALRPPDDDWTCWNCDFIIARPGRLCFLVGCDPAQKNCSYVCLDQPTNHRSLRRRAGS